MNREKALKLLEELREAAALGTPIIVEGKRDEKALNSLGVYGQIICLQATPGGTKSLGLARRLARAQKGKRTVIILTDPDKEGNRICRRISEIMEKQFGIHPELKFRRMTRLFEKSAVEDLDNVLFP